MRHDEEDVEPHQPEMPDARSVVSSKERCEPMELHGLVNRPPRSDRKEPGDRNREVCCTLERVVLCLTAWIGPLAPRQLSERKTNLIRNILSASSRSVRRGSKDRQPPPMASP